MMSEQTSGDVLSDNSAHAPEGAEFIELLNLIEDEIRPSTCAALGINFWPLLRFQLNSQRKKGELSARSKELPALPKSGWSAASWLSRFKRSDRELGWLDDALKAFPRVVFDPFPETQTLYLNRARQYRRIGHTVLQPVTDGLRWIVGEERPQLSLTKKDPRHNGEEFLVPTEILPETRLARPINLIKPKSNEELQAHRLIFAKINHVNAYLEKHANALRLNEFTILDRLERNAAEMVYYAALFEKVRPKTVFLSSYSGAHYICAAARHLGITVVDVQHGGMYPSHPLAANWRKPPTQGYASLPDIFWCWSDDTAHWVSSTIGSYHQAIVGGNPKVVVEQALESTAFAPSLPPRSESTRSRVLVALQYGKNELIPSHVRGAYEATKDRIDWRFRLHPSGRNRLTEAVEILQIDAEEILEFSDCTVQQAMAPMDVLLTDASTIVYESLSLGLRTAVWSDMGADLYAHLVEAGTLSTLRTTHEIVDFVSQPVAPRAAGDQSENQAENARSQIQNAFRKLTE